MPQRPYLATSSIARGPIVLLDEGEARAIPGVLEILTHKNVGDRIKPGKIMSGGGCIDRAARLRPRSARGQIVAVVIADSFEAAHEAAHRLTIRYAEGAPSATFGSSGRSASRNFWTRRCRREPTH
jgi:xanthine dehydrogenase YagR molybdenum-binding subunit